MQRQTRELDAKDAQLKQVLRELQEQLGRVEQLERAQYDSGQQLAVLRRESEELRAERERALERVRSSDSSREEQSRRAADLKSKAIDSVKQCVFRFLYSVTYPIAIEYNNLLYEYTHILTHCIEQ